MTDILPHFDHPAFAASIEHLSRADVVAGTGDLPVAGFSTSQ